MKDCKEDLTAILAAWDILIARTNDPNATAESIEEAYQDYDLTVMDVAVKHGNPGHPYPRRRP